MLVKVGCEFIYESSWPTPAVMQVRPRPDGDFRVLDEAWRITPPLALHAYSDIYGNTCQRMVIPAGDMVLSYDAMIEVSGQADKRSWRTLPGEIQLTRIEVPPGSYTLVVNYYSRGGALLVHRSFDTFQLRAGQTRFFCQRVVGSP